MISKKLKSYKFVKLKTIEKKIVIFMIYVFVDNFNRCKSLFIFKNKFNKKNVFIRKKKMITYYTNVKIM